MEPVQTPQLNINFNPQDRATFNGKHYSVKLDHKRLSLQFTKIEELMKDYQWHTVQEVATAVHGPENSVSAQIRNLRKARFGGHAVDAVRVTEDGLFVYRLRKPEEPRGDAFGKWIRKQAKKYGVKGIYDQYDEA